MEEALEQYPKRRMEDRPSRRFRKGMYVLPSLFTTANVALGCYAIMQVIHGVVQYGIANGRRIRARPVGRIARMTHTTSDFGRELDSLADVITFGIAPALLAWGWGFQQISADFSPDVVTKLTHLGAIASFLFLIAGASRLARFNITVNPQPSNPGRPGKKYFVGMPIPAAAGVIAAVVHFSGGDPIVRWGYAVAWIVIVVVAAYLMVSTWRFYSFKDIDFRARQPFRLIVIFGLLFAAIWFFSKPVLFVVALTYMFSGVFWRLQWVFRRRRNPPPPPAYKEASQTS